jgi:hypothetical protein
LSAGGCELMPLHIFRIAGPVRSISRM